MSATRVTKSATQSDAAEKPFSLLPEEKLIEMYTAMLHCRELARRSDGRIGPGREAVLAGALIDLLPGDGLALAEPDPLARFVLGASLQWVVRKLAAKSLAVAMRGQQATVGETLAEARAAKRRKAGELVMVLLPTGWRAGGEWSNAMEAAWKQKLPMIFVAADGAQGYVPCFPAIPVDRADAVAIYRVASEAMARARKGGWPTLIDCVPYVVEGQKRAKAADPLAQMESYLRAKQLFRPQLRKELLQTFERRLNAEVCS